MHILRSLLRLAFCLLISLTVWEVCARIDDRLNEGVPLLGNHGVATMLTSDEFGVVGRPYGRYLKWKLNAHGYRGPDLHPGRVRILCIGASETFGMTETEGMEYPRQLERELNARAKCERYETVNTAFAGQSLGSFSHRVDRIVETVTPNHAVIYPSFFGYIEGEGTGDTDAVEWVRDDPGFHPRIEAKIFHLYDQMPPWASDLRNRYHIWRATRHSAVVATVPESHVQRFRADLGRVLDRLEQKHVRAILVTHATRFGKRVVPEERHMLTAWRRFTPTLADEGFLDLERRMNEVIQHEAAQRSLRIVDSANFLYGRENFSDWAHFTDRGANKMANLIADQLVPADGPLDPGGL
jgi:hypothetical protein